MWKGGWLCPITTILPNSISIFPEQSRRQYGWSTTFRGVHNQRCIVVARFLFIICQIGSDWLSWPGLSLPRELQGGGGLLAVVHLPLSLLPPPNLSHLPPLIWRFCSHQRALLPPLICIICPPIFFLNVQIEKWKWTVWGECKTILIWERFISICIFFISLVNHR